MATISESVGQNGVNRPEDVTIIQSLLNRIAPDGGGPDPKLTVDGLVGPKTIAAIRTFQQSHAGLVADGRVDPGGATLAKLNALAGENSSTGVQPDSPVANSFVPAHRDRYCIPGQVGSATCSGLASPRPIRRVIMHVVGIPSDASMTGVNKAIRNHQRPGRQAAAHYYVDRDGTVTQMVLEEHVAFHTPGANQDSIGIEHPDICNDPSPLTPEVYERSAALVRDIGRRRGFVVDETTVMGHSLVAGNHADPGPYWDWEYYLHLLAWDGKTIEAKPVRRVATVEDMAVPSGWSVMQRRPIPEDHCASRHDPYGASFWRRQPDPNGFHAEISLLVATPGFYSIALWWPDVQQANPATQIDVLVQEAISPGEIILSESLIVNQRANFGRWNTIGNGFQVESTSVDVLVRIRSDSTESGWILADGVRVLRIGS